MGKLQPWPQWLTTKWRNDIVQSFQDMAIQSGLIVFVKRDYREPLEKL